MCEVTHFPHRYQQNWNGLGDKWWRAASLWSSWWTCIWMVVPVCSMKGLDPMAHMHTHACTHARTHARTHTRTHARTHTYIYTCILPLFREHTCKAVSLKHRNRWQRIYIHIYIYIYMYIYSRTPIGVRVCLPTHQWHALLIWHATHMWKDSCTWLYSQSEAHLVRRHSSKIVCRYFSSRCA